MKRIEDFDIIFTQDGITGRRLAFDDDKSLEKGDSHEIVHLSLAPGTVLEPHTTPFDAKFIVFNGDGVMLIADENDPTKIGKIPCEVGMIFDCKGNIPHGMKNTSDSAFEVLVVKRM